jgi:hypothetical protein
MRIRNSGVVGIAVLALLSMALLSGCELREGPKGEYGELGMKAVHKVTQLPQEIAMQDVR